MYKKLFVIATLVTLLLVTNMVMVLGSGPHANPANSDLIFPGIDRRGLAHKPEETTDANALDRVVKKNPNVEYVEGGEWWENTFDNPPEKN